MSDVNFFDSPNSNNDCKPIIIGTIVWLIAALFFSFFIGCRTPAISTTKTTVVKRDTNIVLPEIVSTDTLCFEDAVDLAGQILDMEFWKDSIACPDSIRGSTFTVVDEKTGVTVYLTPTVRGLEINTKVPSDTLCIEDAIVETTTETTTVIKEKEKTFFHKVGIILSVIFVLVFIGAIVLLVLFFTKRFL